MEADTGMQIIEKIARFGNRLGINTGSQVNDVIFLCVTLAVASLVLLLYLFLRQRLFGRRRDGDGFDRMGGVLGRLEKLEMIINQLKTESARSFELLRGDVGYFKQEVSEIKRALSLGEGALDSGGTLGTGAAAPVPEYSPSSLLEQPRFAELAEEQMLAPAQPYIAEPLALKLTKSRATFFSFLKELFSSKTKIDEEMLDEIEVQLVSSDLGIQTARALVEEVKKDIRSGLQVDQFTLAGIFKMKILNLLEAKSSIDTEISPLRRGTGPLVVMVVGVNGSGKTTTTAKLSARWKNQGAKVLMVAADTFRAAAVEQLVEWGRRISVPVLTGSADTKPSTVVFDALQRARSDNVDVVIIDTAGRLHTKSNLMEELEGVRNIIQKSDASAPHEIILVLDGTTGVNALSQAKEFNEAVPLTGLVVTKLDGTSKGGIVVAIKNELQVPVRYIGVGEAKEDLRPFVARDFVEALFSPPPEEAASVNAELRRRKRGSSGSLGGGG